MKNLKPEIYRQRLIVEGFYTVEVTEDFVRDFLKGLGEELGMRPIGEPYVFSPDAISDLHHGLGGFMAWAESGVALYTWSAHKFFTVDIYTCKPFAVDAAVKYVVGRLGCKEYVYCEVGYED